MIKKVDMERITMTLEDMVRMPQVLQDARYREHWTRCDTLDILRGTIWAMLASRQMKGWQRRVLTAIYTSDLLMEAMICRVRYTQDPERMIRLAVYLYRKAEVTGTCMY